MSYRKKLIELYWNFNGKLREIDAYIIELKKEIEKLQQEEADRELQLRMQQQEYEYDDRSTNPTLLALEKTLEKQTEEEKKLWEQWQYEPEVLEQTRLGKSVNPKRIREERSDQLNQQLFGESQKRRKVAEAAQSRQKEKEELRWRKVAEEEQRRQKAEEVVWFTQQSVKERDYKQKHEMMREQANEKGKISNDYRMALTSLQDKYRGELQYMIGIPETKLSFDTVIKELETALDDLDNEKAIQLIGGHRKYIETLLGVWPSDSVSKGVWASDSMSEEIMDMPTEYRGPRQVGLRNIGNKCYALAVLQCFTSMIPIRDYFVGANLQSNPHGIAGLIKDLLIQLWEGTGGSITPVGIYAYMKRLTGQDDKRFSKDGQEDAGDFLCLLFKKLEGELNEDTFHGEQLEWKITDTLNVYAKNKMIEFKQRNRNILDDVFNTYILSALQEPGVNKGKHRSFSISPEYIISVPVHEVIRKSAVKTLEECLLKYFQTEDGIVWECLICQNNVSAQKQLRIWKTPQILIIQLKRFLTTSISNVDTGKMEYRSVKIAEPIQIPLLLDILGVVHPNSNEKNTKYGLTSIINHYGVADVGHYTTHVRGNVCWYEFNDETCKRRSNEEMNAKLNKDADAYILVYQQVK